MDSNNNNQKTQRIRIKKKKPRITPFSSSVSSSRNEMVFSSASCQSEQSEKLQNSYSVTTNNSNSDISEKEQGRLPLKRIRKLSDIQNLESTSSNFQNTKMNFSLSRSQNSQSVTTQTTLSTNNSEEIRIRVPLKSLSDMEIASIFQIESTDSPSVEKSNDILNVSSSRSLISNPESQPRNSQQIDQAVTTETRLSSNTSEELQVVRPLRRLRRLSDIQSSRTVLNESNSSASIQNEEDTSNGSSRTLIRNNESQRIQASSSSSTDSNSSRNIVLNDRVRVIKLNRIERSIRNNRLVIDANQIKFFIKNYEYFKSRYPKLKVKALDSSSRIKPSSHFYLSDDQYQLLSQYMFPNPNDANNSLKEKAFIDINKEDFKSMLELRLTIKEALLVFHAINLNVDIINEFNSVDEAISEFIQQEIYANSTEYTLTNENLKRIIKNLQAEISWRYKTKYNMNIQRIQNRENFIRYVLETQLDSLHPLAIKKFSYSFNEIFFHVPNEPNYGIPDDFWIMFEIMYDRDVRGSIGHFKSSAGKINSLKKYYGGYLLRLTTNMSWEHIQNQVLYSRASNTSNMNFYVNTYNFNVVIRSLIGVNLPEFSIVPTLMDLGGEVKNNFNSRSVGNQRVVEKYNMIIDDEREMSIISAAVKIKDVIKDIEDYQVKISALKEAKSLIKQCYSNSEADVNTICGSFFTRRGLPNDLETRIIRPRAVVRF